MSTFRFCPRCGTALVATLHAGKERPSCPTPECGFVQWGNPTPVVAAVIEKDGQVLLARGKGWPEKFFALVAGFLEAGESPQAAVLREVKEETNLDGEVVSLIGVYPFELRNEVILAFHVRATGEVKLSDELEQVKLLPKEKVRWWPQGTGLAIRDWLRAQGVAVD